MEHIRVLPLPLGDAVESACWAQSGAVSLHYRSQARDPNRQPLWFFGAQPQRAALRGIPFKRAQKLARVA